MLANKLKIIEVKHCFRLDGLLVFSARRQINQNYYIDLWINHPISFFCHLLFWHRKSIWFSLHFFTPKKNIIMTALTLKHVYGLICYVNKCLFHAISIENNKWPKLLSDSKTYLLFSIVFKYVWFFFRCKIRLYLELNLHLSNLKLP